MFHKSHIRRLNFKNIRFRFFFQVLFPHKRVGNAALYVNIETYIRAIFL